MTKTLPAERQATFDDLYQGAMSKDAARARAALTDDFTFKGPVMSFDDPDAFVASMLAVDAAVTDSRVIADGERVAHLFVLDVSAPFQARIPMCDVLEFRGNRIHAIDLYTDSRLFGPAVG